MAIKFKKDALVKNLVTGYKLAPHLDKFIGQGDFEWSATFSPKQGDDAWHPSGDCTPSLHQLYMSATGQTTGRPISTSLRKTFQVGHFWHAYLQEIVVRLGFCDETAIERKGKRVWAYQAPPGHEDHKPKPYHWATGSGDIAPCSIPKHGDYLVDIKTMGAHDYKRQGMPEWAAAKYECQINVYMDWFDLDQAIILCVCKDSPHDMKEFVFERNQPLIDAIYQKWELVSYCIREEVTPPEDEEFELPVAGCVS